LVLGKLAANIKLFFENNYRKDEKQATDTNIVRNLQKFPLTSMLHLILTQGLRMCNCA